MEKKINPHRDITTTTQNIKITYKGYYQCYQIITEQEKIGDTTKEETIHYKTNLRRSTFHNIYTYIKRYIKDKKRQQELGAIIRTIDLIYNKQLQNNYYKKNPNSKKYKIMADIQYKVQVKTETWRKKC